MSGTARAAGSGVLLEAVTIPRAPDSCLSPIAKRAVAKAEIGGKEMVVRERDLMLTEGGSDAARCLVCIIFTGRLVLYLALASQYQAWKAYLSSGCCKFPASLRTFSGKVANGVNSAAQRAAYTTVSVCPVSLLFLFPSFLCVSQGSISVLRHHEIRNSLFQPSLNSVWEPSPV